LKESAKRLIEYKIQEYGVGHLFEVQESQIKTPGDGLIVFAGLQDHTAESIKSYEGFDVAWVEEAQTVSQKSLNLLRPTIRKPGSELWFSWNPRLESDPVDKMFRGAEVPTGSVVAHANWDKNPWFPAELEQERLDCIRMQPEQYDHIWEGDYVTVSEGAYYAKQLAEVKLSGRLTTLSPDPLFVIRAYCDLGGPGAKADAFSMWICQFVGGRVNVLDYYEARGQPLAEHLAWLRSKGLGPGKVEVFLPHDGLTESGPNPGSFESAFNDAGYSATTLRNEGSGRTGARSIRIAAARRLFQSIWFDAEKCKPGLKALGWYHEKVDPDRSVGLGPDHDWSSHAADAFGLMCLAYEPPRATQKLDYSMITRRVV
jgi:phage terminase large subunit